MAFDMSVLQQIFDFLVALVTWILDLQGLVQ
jgi:hypothetical protein